MAWPQVYPGQPLIINDHPWMENQKPWPFVLGIALLGDFDPCPVGCLEGCLGHSGSYVFLYLEWWCKMGVIPLFINKKVGRSGLHRHLPQLQGITRITQLPTSHHKFEDYLSTSAETRVLSAANPTRG